MSYPIMPTMPISMAKGLKKTPNFNSTGQKNAAGMGNSYVSLKPYPTWDFEFDLDHVTGNEAAATSVVSEFLSIYMQCNGQTGLFLFTDPQDNTVTNMSFGTGDGTTVAFQLSRTIGGSAIDVIQNPNVITNIKVNGVTKTAGVDYSVSSTGVITFASAPANSAALTWTGSFYFLCRFDADTVDSTRSFTINSGTDQWMFNGIKFSSEFVTGSAGSVQAGSIPATGTVVVTGTPSAGQVLTATSSIAADWQTPAGADWINALNLGAKADGSTDNYSAIQTWVNNLSSSAVLYFPTGTFNFATAVTLNKYVQAIRGDGVASSTLQVPNSSATNSIFVSSATANEIATGFTIEGICFNGPGQNASSTATGVVISNQSTNAVSLPRIIDCKFSNFPSYAFDLEIPILGVLESIDIVSCGRGYKINGGTSTNAHAVYVNNVLKQGHDWVDHSYGTMSGCAADSPGIGYLIRGGGSTLSISGCGSEVGTPLNLTVTNTVSNGTTATVTYSGADQSAEYFTGMTVQVTGTSNGSGALNGRKVITSVSTNTISFASAASFSSASDSGTCSMFPGDNFQFISRTCDTIESIYAAGGGSNAGGIGLLIGGTSTLMSVKGFNCTNGATYDLYTGTGCSKLLLENNNYSGGNFLGASTVETLSNGNRYIAGFIQLVSGGVIQWNADTGLSRASAGVIDVGNGTAANASGTVNAGQYNVAGSQIAAANLANGTTGSGSIVLATSPTLSALTISGALTDSTSSTGTNGQVLSSTGSATKWITPSASGTVNSGTANQIAYYAGSGTAVSGDSLLTDTGTALAYTGTGGITIADGSFSAPTLNFSGHTTSGLFLATSVGSPPSLGIGISLAGVDSFDVWDDGVNVPVGGTYMVGGVPVAAPVLITPPPSSVTNTQLTSNVATYTCANSFVAGQLVTTTGCSSPYNVTLQQIQSASATQFTVNITHANIGSAGASGSAYVPIEDIRGSNNQASAAPWFVVSDNWGTPLLYLTESYVAGASSSPTLTFGNATTGSVTNKIYMPHGIGGAISVVQFGSSSSISDYNGGIWLSATAGPVGIGNGFGGSSTSHRFQSGTSATQTAWDMAQFTGSALAAPGSGFGRLEWLAGTDSGTLKLAAYSGTSTSATIIADNVGTDAGVTTPVVTVQNSGSASAPTLIFSSSTTTGLYLESAVGSPSSYGVGVAVAGAVALSIYNDGINIPTGSTYQINGSQIAASNLSNGTTGSGAVVLAGSPIFTTQLTTANLLLTGTVTEYDGITTSLGGVCPIVASALLQSQTANVGSTSLIAASHTPANGMVRISVQVVLITAATTGSATSTLPTPQITFQERYSNTSQTITLVAHNNASPTANVAGTTLSYGCNISIRSASAVSFATTGYASNTAAQMAFTIIVNAEYFGG